jgi:xylulose-5-phosphate/fructose-6-phosphate phosphoketolase
MRIVTGAPLSDGELARLDAHWRAANYLSVGQIYLMGNALLRAPVRPAHIKRRLLGHWGTTPGLNIIYTHVNRIIAARGIEVLFITGPGHGGPGLLANVWLEGTLSEIYPTVGRDEPGMAHLFKQFSFPGGVPSHVAPETPGSIHEGGELGYSLAQTFGAVFDNPELVAVCVVGDGEAETGPLATAWHSTRFLNPTGNGTVLPILHLNGYKIANPTVLGRMSDEELTDLFTGYGYTPYLVAGHEPAAVHQQMAATLDTVFDSIAAIREHAPDGVPRWPMLVLRTPKGWTGPKVLGGLPVEGTWRSHQVPLGAPRTDPAQLDALREWLESYRPEDLFDESGAPRPDVVDWLPLNARRMGSIPHANGGILTRDLELPDFRRYAVKVPAPGAETAEATRVLGQFLRDVLAANAPHRNFRLFGPDETESNRLDAVYEVTGKAWQGPIEPTDVHLVRDGRVMEILSEHTCQGWLEGYLLTGRHGLSPATRRSSTSSTRCSTSTRSGSRYTVNSPGGARSLR